LLVCPLRLPSICHKIYFFKQHFSRGSYRQTSRLSAWNRPSLIIHYPIHLIANNYGASWTNNSKAGVSRVSCISRGCIISDSTTDIVDHYMLYELFRTNLQFLSHKNVHRHVSYAPPHQGILSFGTCALDILPFLYFYCSIALHNIFYIKINLGNF